MPDKPVTSLAKLGLVNPNSEAGQISPLGALMPSVDWQAEAQFWRSKYIELQTHNAEVVARLAGSPGSSSASASGSGDPSRSILEMLVRQAAKNVAAKNAEEPNDPDQPSNPDPDPA